MSRKSRSINLISGTFPFIFLVFPDSSLSQPVPASILQNLESDKFELREAGQTELQNWARKEPGKSLPLLLQQARKGADPEVRARCLAVLKNLVIENGYRGEGFLGIAMLEAAAKVPGDAEPRQAIRVSMVLKNSPAEKAGIIVGDLIVGLDGHVWRAMGMVDDFSRKVRETAPGTTVKLLVLKDEKAVTRIVVLAKKPPPEPDPDGNKEADPDRLAKERFFQGWLDKQDAGGR